MIAGRRGEHKLYFFNLFGRHHFQSVYNLLVTHCIYLSINDQCKRLSCEMNIFIFRIDTWNIFQGIKCVISRNTFQQYRHIIR